MDVKLKARGEHREMVALMIPQLKKLLKGQDLKS